MYFLMYSVNFHCCNISALDHAKIGVHPNETSLILGVDTTIFMIQFEKPEMMPKKMQYDVFINQNLILEYLFIKYMTPIL